MRYYSSHPDLYAAPMDRYQQEQLAAEVMSNVNTIVKAISKNILDGETQLADAQSASLSLLLKALNQERE